MSEQEFWEDEEDVAVAALGAWMEVDGDDELAEAQRVALVAIAQEAVELKEQREEEARRRARAREERLRQEARRQEEAEARVRRDEERARQRARERREAHERQERERRRSEVSRLREAEVRAQRAAEARRRRVVEAPRSTSDRPQRAQVGRRTRGSGQPGPEAIGKPGQANAATRTPSIAPSPMPEVVNTGPSREHDPGTLRAPPRPRSRAARLNGADLAAWRKSLGLTQQAAADRLGVRQGTISKAEGRACKPLGPTLHQALAVEVASK